MTILSKQYPMDLGTGTIEQVNQSAAKIDNELTAIYGHLNNIRVRYRGATAPTNPEVGQQWEDTVNAKVMKWNGSAWVEDIAKSLNLTNRNTVLQGQVSSVGALELILGSTSALTADLVSSAIETIIVIPAGHDATTGNLDYIVSFSATQTDFWTSLPASNTSYLFVDYAAGTVTGVYSVIAPVYQSYAPAHSAGKNWYDTNKEQWYLSDGSNWVAKYRCYVGSVVTDGTKVTAVSIYPYNVLRTNITGHASLDLALTGGTMSGLLNLAKGNDVASASTVNLSTATGNTVHITGTTGISAFTMTSGQVMDVIFDGALTLTHHTTNNNLPSAANITTVAGDRARYFYDGTTVYCLQYQRADGQALIIAASSGGVVEYLTPGTYSWTAPAGVTQVEIEIGAGGGGGSRGGDAEPGAGGGCGEYKPFAPYTVTPGQVLTVSVGAGGPGSTSQSADGTAGGASGVGTLVSCTGGGGGQNEDAGGYPAGGAKGGGLYAQDGAGVMDTGGETPTKCAGCGGSLAEASGKIGIGGGSRDASLRADTYALIAKLLRWIAGNYTPTGNVTDAVGVCAGGGGGPQTMSASRGGNGAPGFVRIRW